MPKRGFLYSLPEERYMDFPGAADLTWYRRKQVFGPIDKEDRAVFDYKKFAAVMHKGYTVVLVSSYIYGGGFNIQMWSFGTGWVTVKDWMPGKWPEVLRYAETLLRLEE